MTPETRRRLAALGKINRITGFELEDTDRVREKLLEHYRERVFVERRMGGEKVRISLISDEMQIWLENLTDV